MTAPKFGSDWTAQKLGAVSDYAHAWMRIMNAQRQKWGWRCRYIDAFSGSGSYEPAKRDAETDLQKAILFAQEETDAESDEIKKGSAQIAMEIVPRFDIIDLIEKNPRFAQSLRNMAGQELNKSVFVHNEDANNVLTQICRSLSRRNDRALIFIDPFGCQVWWETLKAVAASQVADVFYLFPTMGINRQVAGTLDQIKPQTQQLLDRVLGTSEWRDEFYKTETVFDLFGPHDETLRASGPDVVERFFIRRLETIFPCVHKKCLQLKNRRNGHMFSLCFAVSNPNQTAQKRAIGIARDVIKKWGAKR